MLLTRKECSALRGIAILGIMLHNYCHWLRVAVKENEFTFSEANNERLLSVLADPDWNLPIHLISYFGHYGVPLFLFLSGYGLVKKYETPTTPPCLPKGEGFAGWCRLHYLKLFRMMIVGFVLFLVVDNVTPGAHRYQLLDVVAQLLMFNNLLPSPDKVIWPGPFWFFGLMMQLYIVYRLLVCRRHWGLVVGLIALCWLVQLPFLGDVATLNWLRYNCVSGMLPFGLGVLAGRYGGHVALSGVEAAGRAVGAVLLVLGVLLAVAGCLLSAHTWLWVPALVIVAGVGLVKLLPQRLMELFAWTGGISAAMFVAHPALRKLFIPISHRGDLWTGLLLYVVATVFVSWLVQLVIDKMPKPQS